MQITRKRINDSYSLEETVLENVEKIKYLGVTITNDLKWNTHVSNICTKANRTLGFLRRNLAACPLDVKQSAYKGLVRPILEYGSSVWDSQSIRLQDELEKVQKKAARFVTGNYVDYESGSMTGILKQLKWESLKKRRNHSILFYPITLEGRRGTTDEFATIPFHLDLFSAALVELAKSIPVHSLILSSHLFFCLPLFLFPFTVPCRIVFAKQKTLRHGQTILAFVS